MLVVVFFFYLGQQFIVRIVPLCRKEKKRGGGR